MFYNDYCKTNSQKTVYKALLELSKNGKFITIQELDYLDISRSELEEILSYFETKQLFESVQHLSETYPVLFSLKT